MTLKLNIKKHKPTIPVNTVFCAILNISIPLKNKGAHDLNAFYLSIPIRLLDD